MLSLGFLTGEETKVLRRLFGEVYAALQNGMPALAAMGIRAILENVMISTCGDRGSFAGNLKAFEDAGHVSSRQAVRLRSILDVGHAAMHRGYIPDAGDIPVLLDITEHIVESVYAHDLHVQRLQQSVPPKAPKTP
jgi:hypothetical protein